MDAQIEKTLSSLQARHINGIFAEDASEADLNVILVNRDLGLGWDPSWPKERIAAIAEGYKKLVSIPL
jgi:hypothetical protein